MKVEVRNIKIDRGWRDNPHYTQEVYIDGVRLDWFGSVDSLLYTLEQRGYKVELINK